MEKSYFCQRSTKCGCCIKDFAATGLKMLERKRQPKGTEARHTYLKVGNNMLRAFTEESLSVKERSKLTWSAVCFCKAVESMD